MAKKDKEVKEIPVDYRIVLYTDGGCVPNPGNAGYGVHGYSYRETGVNINRFRLTKRATTTGYAANDDVKEEARVYALDTLSAMGMVSPGEKSTNNAAELLALVVGFREARQYQPSDRAGRLLSVYVLADSKYAIRLFELLYKTKRKNERLSLLQLPRRDGTQMPNIQLATQLLQEIEALEALNVELTIGWVKGHNGNTGNEQADVFATMGVRQATQYSSRSAWLHAALKQHHVRWMDARAFWRDRDGYPALVDHVNVVYANDLEDYVSRTLQFGGEEYRTYLLSTEANEFRAEKKAPPINGESDDEEVEEDAATSESEDVGAGYPKVAGRLAHRKANTTRALVLLKDNMALVDSMCDMYRQDRISRYVMNDIILIKLAKLYSDEFQTGYSVMGNDLIEMHDNTLNPAVHDLSRVSLAYKGDYLTVHVKPQKVSLYMLDQYVQMQYDLYAFLNGHHSGFSGVEDISALYYTVDEKGKTILRPDRKVGFKRLDHEHSAVMRVEGMPEEDTTVVGKMVLVNSIHLPDRNALKRLESHNPKITLISRQLAYVKDNFATMNFFIVIQTDIGFGIYEAEASNLVLIPLTR